jgi:hypothetical protein
MLKKIMAGLVVLSTSMLFAMEQGGTDGKITVENQAHTRAAADLVPVQSSAELYVPENIDVTCCLESSGKCCYVTHAACQFGVGVCELASLICAGLCAVELKEYPNLAWGLALASAMTNLVSMGLTYALVKTGSKIRKLDRAIGEAKSRRAGSEARAA